MQFLELAFGHRYCRPARHLSLEVSTHLDQIVIDGEALVVSDVGIENQRIEQVPLIDGLNRRSLTLPGHNQALLLQELYRFPNHRPTYLEILAKYRLRG